MTFEQELSIRAKEAAKNILHDCDDVHPFNKHNEVNGIVERGLIDFYKEMEKLKNAQLLQSKP